MNWDFDGVVVYLCLFTQLFCVSSSNTYNSQNNQTSDGLCLSRRDVLKLSSMYQWVTNHVVDPVVIFKATCPGITVTYRE